VEPGVAGGTRQGSLSLDGRLLGNLSLGYLVKVETYQGVHTLGYTCCDRIVDFPSVQVASIKFHSAFGFFPIAIWIIAYAYLVVVHAIFELLAADNGWAH
jgi:hypothetical protein